MKQGILAILFVLLMTSTAGASTSGAWTGGLTDVQDDSRTGQDAADSCGSGPFLTYASGQIANGTLAPVDDSADWYRINLTTADGEVTLTFSDDTGDNTAIPYGYHTMLYVERPSCDHHYPTYCAANCVTKFKVTENGAWNIGIVNRKYDPCNGACPSPPPEADPVYAALAAAGPAYQMVRDTIYPPTGMAINTGPSVHAPPMPNTCGRQCRDNGITATSYILTAS